LGFSRNQNMEKRRAIDKIDEWATWQWANVKISKES
jgi:hypothetical protein